MQVSTPRLRLHPAPRSQDTGPGRGQGSPSHREVRADSMTFGDGFFTEVRPLGLDVQSVLSWS